MKNNILKIAWLLIATMLMLSACDDGQKPSVSPTSVVLSIAEHTLKVDETVTITAKVLPAEAYDKSLTWSSSDEKVATVKEGKVTAVGVGTATIIAKTVNGKMAKATITVVPKIIEATKIALNLTEKSLNKGETVTLEVTFTPDDVTDKSIKWSSSDDKIATVKDGVVTAVAPGEAIITAETTNGQKATATITVLPIEATQITLNLTEKSLNKGETVTLEVTFTPVDVTDKSIKWSSSDDKIATVKDGVVTAVATGEAIITAETANGLKATATITVLPVVATKITLNLTEKSLNKGETVTLEVTFIPDDVTDKSIKWSSSDDKIATVKDGVVTAVATGEAIITAETANGLKATAKIIVAADKSVIPDVPGIEL